jgi:hypothetical protein
MDYSVLQLREINPCITVLSRSHPSNNCRWYRLIQILNICVGTSSTDHNRLGSFAFMTRIVRAILLAEGKLFAIHLPLYASEWNSPNMEREEYFRNCIFLEWPQITERPIIHIILSRITVTKTRVRISNWINCILTGRNYK